MAAESIGPARCPFCGGRARLTLAKSLLPVLTCNGCNSQAFARSDRSDGLFRSLLIADKPAAADAPAPTPAPAPAATSSVTPPAVAVRTESGPRVGFFGG